MGEIYKAVCDFNPPQTNDSSENNILSFRKGDRFEVVDSNKLSSDWWGATAIKDNSVGYVPSKYLKLDERKVGRLTTQTDDHKILREKSLKRLAAIRQSAAYIPPDELYPDIPLPDYDESDNEADDDDDSIHKNNNNDGSQNSRNEDEDAIEDACPALPEPTIPEPDYHSEDEQDSLDAPVLRRSRDDVTVIKIGYDPNSGMSEHKDNRMTSDVQQRIRLGSDSDGQGLILPKKLINPCVESSLHKALHRELLINKKSGKDVLKKSELQKKLTEREDIRRKKEQEEYKTSKRTSLEMKLEERADRLKQEEQKSMKPIAEEEPNTSELSRIYAKIRAHKADH